MSLLEWHWRNKISKNTREHVLQYCQEFLNERIQVLKIYCFILNNYMQLVMKNLVTVISLICWPNLVTLCTGLVRIKIKIDYQMEKINLKS